MNYDKVASTVSRISIFGAVALIVLGLVEGAANMFGYTVIPVSYTHLTLPTTERV